MSRSKVIVLEDDDSLRFVISKALTRAGLEMRATASMSTALDLIGKGEGDLLIADVVLGDDNFLKALPELSQSRPDLPIIVISAQSTSASAIHAQKHGAFEFLAKPFDLNDLVEAVNRARAHKAGRRSSKTLPTSDVHPFLVGQSAAIQAVLKSIGRLARHQAPVLVEGHPGAGRHAAIHTLNQARGYDQLEIMGGARFEQTSTSTSPFTRPMYLRDLHSWSSAAQSYLHDSLLCGDIRYPLYLSYDPAQSERIDPCLVYMLGMHRLKMPSLIERKDDFEAVTTAIVEGHGFDMKRLSVSALQALKAFDWPGQIQQLKSVVLQALSTTDGVLKADDVAPFLVSAPSNESQNGLYRETLAFCEVALNHGESNIRDKALHQLDKALIHKALQHTQGVRQDAAKLLGLNRNTLARRMEQLQMGSGSAD